MSSHAAEKRRVKPLIEHNRKYFGADYKRNYTATQDRAIPGFSSEYARANTCFLFSAEESWQCSAGRAE